MSTKPKTRPPARPATRPAQPRAPIRAPQRTGNAQRAPIQVERPDTTGVLRRGFVKALGRAAGAVAAVVDPDPLNEGETEFLSNPRYRHPADFAEGIDAIDTKGDDRAVVHFNGRREVWSPPRYRLPPHVEVGPPDPLARHGQPAARPVPLRKDRGHVLYDPYENPDDPLSDPDPYSRAAPVGDPFRDPNWRPTPGWIDLPHRRPDPVPVPVPDPLPVAPPGRSPLERWHQGLVISVRPSEWDGPSMHIRPKLYRELNMSHYRYQDTKGGRRLVGMLNYVVTATYGLVSEAQDAAEVFAWNVYGRQGDRIVPAMLLENRSMIGVFQGYLEGDYRVDAVGFAVDFAINQAEDYAYALQSRAMMRGAQMVAGPDLGYKAMRQHQWANRLGSQGDSYVQSSISEAQSWVRSFDVQRRSRVQSLW